MFEGRLVAVMVTDKSRNSLYLKRYCVSARVVGGFSKLLKYVVSNVHPQSVYTFSDNRWFDGNMYKSCGFTLEKELPPDYWYFKGESRRWHKSHYRKSKIEGILPEETEWQAMQRLKYDRIWDCGKKKWVLTF